MAPPDIPFGGPILLWVGGGRGEGACDHVEVLSHCGLVGEGQLWHVMHSLPLLDILLISVSIGKIPRE